MELQDAKGKPIPGYTIGDCDTIAGNEVAYPVKWKGAADVADLAGKPVRLKIVMDSAKLYAFQFRGDRAGS